MIVMSIVPVSPRRVTKLYNCHIRFHMDRLDHSRLMWHTTAAMYSRPELPDFREARHPSRIYSGMIQSGNYVVRVLDSSLPEDDTNPRPLAPEESRHVKDHSDTFRWGESKPGTLQLAIALLLDVSGEASTALRWYPRFSETYVRRLPATWTVPELDIALWIHCFENARQDD